MNALLPPSPPGRGRLVADLLMTLVQGGGFTSLEGGTDADRAAVLDRLSAELAGLRVRCLRLRRSASGRIGLPELTAQVAGEFAAQASQTAHPRSGAPVRTVELAFEALTEPGEDAVRIVLIVDAADALGRPAVRYVQLACQRCPQLRVVFAGPSGFLDELDQGIPGFQERIACRLHLSGAPGRMPSAPAPAVVAPAGTLLSDTTDTGPTLVEMARASRGNAWSLVGAGLAASLLLATWTTNWSEVLTGGGAVRSASAPVNVASVDAAPVNVATVTAATEPGAAPAPPPVEAADAPDPSLTAAELPVPPIPPAPIATPGAPSAAVPAAKAPRAVVQQPLRSSRGPNERLVSMQAPQTDWARCREIVLMAQLGERLTSAEQRFLRDGCKTR